jgi:hypothetical protein
MRTEQVWCGCGGQECVVDIASRLIEDYGRRATAPRHQGQEESLETTVLIREELGEGMALTAFLGFSSFALH